VALTAGAPPSRIVLGKAFDWVLTVTNRGPGVAPDVRVHAGSSGSFNLVSVETTQGTCEGPNCTLGTLKAGEKAEVKLTLYPWAGGGAAFEASLRVFGATDVRASNNFATFRSAISVP
jgi:hypothetical protein